MDLVIEPCHPLLLDTVFRSLTEYMTYQDMIQSRLVSREWLVIIDEILNNRSNVSFQKFECIGRVFSQMSKIENVGKFTVHDFDFDLRREIFWLLRVPKFRFLSKLVIRESWLSTETFLGLLRAVGPRLDVLHVHVATPQSLEDMTDHPPLLIPFLPMDGYKENYPHVKIFVLKSELTFFNMVGIARNFPGLIELEIIGAILETKIPEDIDGLMRKLRTLSIRPNRRCKTPWDDHLLVWTKMKLNLVKLELVDIYKTTNMNILKSFLESQQTSLKSLKLSSNATPNEPDYVEFKPNVSILPDVMPQLTELSLPKIYIKNLAQILNAVPNVQRLAFMFQYDEYWTGILPKKIKPHPSVRRIVLAYIEPQCLTKLAKVFINLESLALFECNEDLIRVAFTEFNKLKFLKIGFSDTCQITDLGLLGILSGDPPEELQLQTDDNIGGFVFVPDRFTDPKVLAHLNLSWLEISVKSFRQGHKILPEQILTGIRLNSKKPKVSSYIGQICRIGFSKLIDMPTSSGVYVYAKHKVIYD